MRDSGSDYDSESVIIRELRERETQYREIFSATTDAMFIADMEGYIVEVNACACAMYNVEYDELVRSRSRILSAEEIETIEYPGHLGLRTMAERAPRLNGTLEIDSAVGRGTRLRATIPPRA